MNGDAVRRARDDAEARRAAQTDFARPLALQAGAGTGKTSALVARLLHWCLGPGWNRRREAAAATGAEPASPDALARAVLGGVRAITFTDAAAAEMSRRAAAGLAQLAGGETVPRGFDPGALELEPAELRRRAGALLGHLDHLQVTTFHSWCHGLLQAHPFEAGIHPGFRLDADGLAGAAAADEVFEAHVDVLYGSGRRGTPAYEDAVALQAEGLGPEALRSCLRDLVQAAVPSAALRGAPWAAERAWPLLERLDTLLNEVSRGLDRVAARVNSRRRLGVLEELRTRIAAMAVECRRRLEEEAPGTPLGVVLREVGTMLPVARLATLRAWSRGTTATTWEKDAVAPLLPELGRPAGELAHLAAACARLQPERLERVFRLLLPMLQEVEELCRRRGILRFDDLLDRAQHLLESQPRVLGQQRRRHDQLLVDEFQDTDPRQCALVRLLALTGPPEERPGLFLVGDPQQSLYGWRQADLAAYQRFLDDVREAGGRVLSLLLNFRSVPEILHEVDAVIEPVLRAEPGVQPPFASLLPHRPSIPAGELAVEYWLSDRQLGADARSRLEAEAVVRDLLHRHAAGSRWSDFAILGRSQLSLQAVLTAMRDQGIPFQVSRQRSYYQRREILEAETLLRVLVQPRDRLALVAFLRAAWVGVPDAALAPLFAREDFEERVAALGGPDDAPLLTALRELVETVAAHLPATVPGLATLGPWSELLLTRLADLGHLRRLLNTAPADRWVATLRERLTVDALEAARPAGSYRAANLDRFFRDLTAALERGDDLPSTLRRLARDVAELRPVQEPPPSEATRDAVAVMTIHGAKGLDFEHVYLLRMDTEPRASAPTFAARRPADRGEDWALHLLGQSNPAHILDGLGSPRREAAERVRMLYVAMTRPRRRLVLAGRDHPAPHAGADPLLVRSHDLLLAWRQPEAPAALADAASGPVRVRRLSDEPEAPDVAAAGPAGWSPPEISALTAARDRQRRRAQAALARQELPLLLRASERQRASRDAPEFAEVAETPDGNPGAESPDARAARQAGIAVHALFQHWPAEAEPDAAFVSLREALLQRLDADSRKRAGELLARFRNGPLYERWTAILPRLGAREFPILAPWRPAAGGTDFTAALVGVVDALYEEEDGSPVLIDFKTDRIEDPARLDEAVERHRHQAEAYRRAVAEALSSDLLPRFEFWFLDAGAVVELAAAPAPQSR